MNGLRRIIAPTAIAIAGALLMWLASRRLLVHVPLYDELLHYLAAQGLLATGRPVIDQGIYTRAGAYTQLVAWAMQWRGHSLEIARWPALASTALLAALIGAWLTRRIGIAAGVTAILTLCTLPAVVEMAVFIRFYALHALLVTAAFITAYSALDARRVAPRIAFGLATLGFLGVALPLQSTTLIAGFALAGAAAVRLALDAPPALRNFFSRQRTPLLLGAATIAGLALFIAPRLGILAPFREAPLWASWAANDQLYYVKSLAEAQPLLWPLLPAALVPALRWHRSLASFALAALTIALAVHSFAAAKSMRYVMYTLPLLCILWACSVDGLLRWAAESRDFAGRHATLITLLLLAAVFALSREGYRLARLVAQRAEPAEVLSYATEPDWTPAAPELLRRARAADRVLTSNSMKALYYLGRYDFELNASIVAETDTRTDFGRDERTGRQAVVGAENVHKLVNDGGLTLVVLEDRKLNSPAGVPQSALAEIQRACATLAMPPRLALSAWECSH